MNEPISAQLDALVPQEDEPPGRCSLEDGEPPSTRYEKNRSRFFGSVPDNDWNDWKWQFQHRISSVEDLVKFIPFSPEERSKLNLVAAEYPLSISPHYFCLIDQDNPNDPVRKQCVPCFEEISMDRFGEEDPLEEHRDSVVPGLVHRYPDRVLMVLTDICPMLCRHCTRKREWRHGNWVRSAADVERMLDYIRRTPVVRDVVLSGGDPLTLATKRLEEVISKLRQIEHVEIIRIGTRFPVVLPQRVDDELCAMLSKYGPIWLNTHFNHPNEITPESARAVDKLVRSGLMVGNQSVLLRGVNDSVETMLKLCRGLLKIKVRPYYLFQSDEVRGTEHLRTSVETGLDIIAGMRGHTSGLAVPTFVIDLPGGGGKVPLQPDYLISQTRQSLILRNYEGRIFHFRNPNPNREAEKARHRANGNGSAVRKAQLSFPEMVPVVSKKRG